MLKNIIELDVKEMLIIGGGIATCVEVAEVIVTIVQDLVPTVLKILPIPEVSLNYHFEEKTKK